MPTRSAVSGCLAALVLLSQLVAIQGRLLLDTPPTAPAPCHVEAAGSLPLYVGSASLAGVSSNGTRPSVGTCLAWNISLAQPGCDQTDGMLLIELWVTDQGRVMDRSRTLDGMYVLVNPGPEPPPVYVYANGDIGIQALPGEDPTADNHFLDVLATADSLPYHRVLVPASIVGEMQWSVTIISSLNLPDSVGYEMRATCAAASEVPCPRPGPALGACGSPLAALDASAGVPGKCIAAPAGSVTGPMCSCSPGYADPACGTHFTNLTATPVSSSVSKNFHLPARTWMYFAVTAQAFAETRLLVELIRPPSSAGAYAPSLVITTGMLPGMSNIPSDSVSCTCVGCSCQVPMEARNLLFLSRVQPAGSSDPVTWYIGVYNSLDVGWQPGSDVEPLQLRSRWTSGAHVSPPLCPMDCSGQGICSSVQTSPQMAEMPTFVCTCSPGYGGRYCQGPQLQVQLSGLGYDSGRTVVQPGRWQFYSVVPASSSSQTVLSWTPDSTLGSTLLLIASPSSSNGTSGLPSTSYPGDAFVSLAPSFVWNSTVSFTLPSPTSVYGWVIAVFNSDANGSITGSFRLVITEFNNNSGLRFSSLLQMALIGSVSALAIVFLAFLSAKVYLLRRFTARAIAREAAAQQELARHLAHAGGAGSGVPTHIVQALPLFPYSAATFGAMGAKASPADLPHNMLKLNNNCSGNGEVHGGSLDKAMAITIQAHQCSICIGDFEEGEFCRQLPCRHTYHASCLDPWLQQHSTCPNCRWHLVADVSSHVTELDAAAQRRLPDTLRSEVITSPSMSQSGTSPASLSTSVSGDSPSAHYQGGLQGQGRDAIAPDVAALPASERQLLAAAVLSATASINQL